jgi:hypothetical protein
MVDSVCLHYKDQSVNLLRKIFAVYCENEIKRIKYNLRAKCTVIIRLLLQSALQSLVGFQPAQLPLSILSRKVLQSAVANGTSNPQLGGKPGI